jgi:hypothetical protein
VPKSTSKVSVQRIGDGTYRVNTRAGRSALTGRFVKQSAVQRHPSTASDVDSHPKGNG